MWEWESRKPPPPTREGCWPINLWSFLSVCHKLQTVMYLFPDPTHVMEMYINRSLILNNFSASQREKGSGIVLFTAPALLSRSFFPYYRKTKRNRKTESNVAFCVWPLLIIYLGEERQYTGAFSSKNTTMEKQKVSDPGPKLWASQDVPKEWDQRKCLSGYTLHKPQDLSAFR